DKRIERRQAAKGLNEFNQNRQETESRVQAIGRNPRDVQVKREFRQTTSMKDTSELTENSRKVPKEVSENIVHTSRDNFLVKNSQTAEIKQGFSGQTNTRHQTVSTKQTHKNRSERRRQERRN